MNHMWELVFYTKLLMILQPQHQHDQAPEEPPQQQNTVIKPKEISKTNVEASLPLPAKKQNTGPPQILTQMLQNSLKLLSDKGSKEIRKKMTYFQEKVHLGFSDGPNQYLLHLSSKLHAESKDTLSELIDIENWLAADRIRTGKTPLTLKTEIPSLKGEITSKLLDMKKSMMSLSSIDKRAESYIQSLLEFKKKNYWLHETESKVKVKNFLTKMKRIQSEQKKRYEKSMVVQENQMRMSLERQRVEREEVRKQMRSKELQRHLSWRREREKNTEEQKRKKDEVQAMLSKLNEAGKPKYKQMQQKFIKNVLEPLQQQRQKKLQQIKAEHQPIDPQQLEQHLQKYQEYKQTLMQQHRKKDEEWQDMNNKLQQELKDLYHGKHHRGIEPRFYNSVKEGKVEARRKVKDYEKEVLEKFRPNIDPLKRSKLQEHIFDLQLREEKNKRKVVMEDGSFVLQDKPQYNARRIGVQYLQKLKEDSQGKPRKVRTSSLLDLPVSSKPKRIDYLRENKPNLVLKKTIGQWKKIVGDDSYSPRQKYESIMQQAAVFQEKARQKQAQMRSYKKGEKALEYSAQMDKYYTESVSAKMVVLKDVILKQ